MSNMVVRTNIFALNAHRNMKNVGLSQRMASNRLSSGYRINSAADDAAGLAISETMRAQIRGLDQASRNAQDGQAMLLTTEGGLDEIGNMLQRTRELLVQAANDTNTQDQRTMIEQEINQLSQEIASMQNRVEFNTNRVLAMGPSMSTDVLRDTGLLQGDNLVVSEAFDAINHQRSLILEAREQLSALNSLSSPGQLSARMESLLDRAFSALQINGVTVGSQAVGGSHFHSGFSIDHTNTFQVNQVANVGGEVNAATGRPEGGQYLGDVLAAISGVFNLGQSLGGTYGAADPAGGNGRMFTLAESVVWNPTVSGSGGVANLTQVIELLNTRMEMLDAAVATLNVIRNAMTEDTRNIYNGVNDFRNTASSGNNVAFFQVGANSGQGIQFDFEEVSRAVSSAASVVQLASIMVSNPTGGQGIGSGIDVSPLINMIQTSLDDINSVRANLGAVQNRMDYTMRSLDISSENLSDSESRVRNADMAREMMRFTMANVLQQASVSMLAQANQMPNNLLQLLR